MHPFNFSKVQFFTCTAPDSSFVLNPAADNKFHWYGKELDKLGKYMLVEAEQLYMELEWNNAREQIYTVISTEGTGDAMRKFVLKDNKTGKLYSFVR